MAKRGRKKKTEDKTSEAGVGHNSVKELSGEERQALHYRHVKEYELSLSAFKAAQADLRQVGKRVKAGGGSVAAIKLTLALRTPEGEEAFRARMAEETEIAYWSGVGVQLSMFDEAMVPADDKAYEAGKRHGLAGERPNNPYHHTLSQHAKYDSGYRDGNEVLARASFNVKPSEDLPKGSSSKAAESFDDAIDDAALESDDDMTPHSESGEVVSRSEWKRRMAENARTADEMIKATA